MKGLSNMGLSDMRDTRKLTRVTREAVIALLNDGHVSSDAAPAVQIHVEFTDESEPQDVVRRLVEAVPAKCKIIRGLKMPPGCIGSIESYEGIEVRGVQAGSTSKPENQFRLDVLVTA